jgi:hypothetical protein
VKSDEVMALRKVFRDPFESTSKGLFTEKFLEPFSTACSKICGVPASDSGIVLKAI